MSPLNPCNNRFTKENHKRRKICQWNDRLTFFRKDETNKIFLDLGLGLKFSFICVTNFSSFWMREFHSWEVWPLEIFWWTLVSDPILRGFKTWSGICGQDRLMLTLLSSLIISSFHSYKGSLINKSPNQMPRVISFLLYKESKVR